MIAGKVPQSCALKSDNEKCIPERSLPGNCFKLSFNADELFGVFLGFVTLPNMIRTERYPRKVEWFDDLKTITFDIQLSLQSDLNKNQVNQTSLTLSGSKSGD
jgi:hypothetical protein